MKKLFLLIQVSLVCITYTTAQSCNPYFLMQEGLKATYEVTNSKNKVIHKSVTQFKNVSGAGNKMKATLLSEVIDAKKGDVINTSESQWTCEDGVMSFTMNAIGIEGLDLSTTGVDVSIEGDEMDIPNALEVGKTLKDVTFKVKVSLSGLNMMDRTFFVKDRKVESRENVTTPAGTFDCYKISYVTESQGKSGGMSKPLNTSIWYTQDVGMVKTESYKNGKMETAQILTKYEK